MINDILNQISRKENVYDYRQISQKRWLEFKDSNITKHVEFDDADIEFQIFYDYLRTLVFTKSGLYKPVAIKILNNGYFA